MLVVTHPMVFSAASASPPNTSGCTYHLIFPAKARINPGGQDPSLPPRECGIGGADSRVVVVIGQPRESLIDPPVRKTQEVLTGL